MSVLPQSRSLSIASILLLSKAVTAWDSTTLTANLAWPPIGNQGTILGYDTQRGNPFVNATFPCANVTPPVEAGARTDFPLSSARLQFNFVNQSLDTSGYEFMIDTYLGQFSDDSNVNQTGFTWVNEPVYKQVYTGPQCSDEVLNVTSQVASAPVSELQLLGDVDGDNLVGVELTLGVKITLFNADHEAIEAVYQCSYLRLVGDDAESSADRGVCNDTPAPSSSSTGSSPSPTTSQGFGPGPVHPPTSTGDSSHNSNLSHAAIAGIAVGAAVGIAAIFLALGCCLLQRKRSAKARQPKPTMELGFWTVGQESSDQQRKEKDKDVDVRVSVYSEPLPEYHRDE